jgi:hypothetical protein
LSIFVTGTPSREEDSEDDKNSADELAALKQPTMWLGAQDGRYKVICLHSISLAFGLGIQSRTIKSKFVPVIWDSSERFINSITGVE